METMIRSLLGSVAQFDARLTGDQEVGRLRVRPPPGR